MPIVQSGGAPLYIPEPIDLVRPALAGAQIRQGQRRLGLAERAQGSLEQYRQQQVGLAEQQQAQEQQKQKLETARSTINTLSSLYKATNDPERQFDYTTRIISTLNDASGTNIALPSRNTFFANQNAYKSLLNEFDKTVKDKNLSPEQKQQKFLIIQSEVNRLGRSEQFAPLAKRTEGLIERGRMGLRGEAAEQLIPGRGIGEAVKREVPTPIITQAITPRKAPTKAGIEGEVISKFMKGEQLTPQEQTVMRGAYRKGFSITLPDGTTIQQGGIGGGIFAEPTPAFKTQTQKELFGARKSLDSLREIRKAFKPEVFGFGGAVRGKVSRFVDNVSPELLPERGVFSKRFINEEVSAKRRAEESFNIYKKNITGVQFSVKELEFLKKAWPVPTDSPTVFEAKLRDVEDSTIRSIARLIRFGYPERTPNKSEVFGVSLSDISPEEMKRTEALLGGQPPQGEGVEDFSTLSDDELLRQLGAQ